MGHARKTWARRRKAANRRILIRLLLGIAFFPSITPATANPDVWVSVETTVLFDQGLVVGLQHVWTFGEVHTATAVEGLDGNKDGVYDRQELAGLAQADIDAMRDHGYFTFANVVANGVRFKAPVDYWYQHKDGILTLHFVLPLDRWVAADAFSFAIYDPSFMIAFSPAKVAPIKIGPDAPQDCIATTALPERAMVEIQRLGGQFPLSGPIFGLSPATTGSVHCGARSSGHPGAGALLGLADSGVVSVKQDGGKSGIPSWGTLATHRGGMSAGQNRRDHPLASKEPRQTVISRARVVDRPTE